MSTSIIRLALSYVIGQKEYLQTLFSSNLCNKNYTIKIKGYAIKMSEPKDYFVHSHGLCETLKVGRGSRVWAFTHILPGATIGENCNVCDHVFIENDVVIGDRVTIKCGVQIWDGISIEDDVFIGPNATFTNDIFPRSKVYPEKFERTIICKGASLGANCTILPGITIGENAMVGAGSVVTRSVPPNVTVVGNPARILKANNL
ncbi:acyltransferase [Pseudomonas mandelii]|uniref:acyltransferase n=1 Tax=Pseudomonas mandelii TaxID=75612 RepID=UPI002B052F57|nr:acyltransferase [Pseudomonas mandelii]